MVLLSKDWVIIEYYLKKEERVKNNKGENEANKKASIK